MLHPQRPIPDAAALHGLDLEDSPHDWLMEFPALLAVFERHAVAYHCPGQSLRYACQQAGLNPTELLQCIAAELGEA